MIFKIPLENLQQKIHVMWTITVLYCVLHEAVEGPKQRLLLRAVGYPEGADGLLP